MNLPYVRKDIPFLLGIQMKHQSISSTWPVILVTTVLLATITLIGCGIERNHEAMTAGESRISKEPVQQKNMRNPILKL